MSALYGSDRTIHHNERDLHPLTTLHRRDRSNARQGVQIT